jgi:carboxypeptidase Taq
MTKDYKLLWEQSTRAELLSGVTQLLDWDQEIFMPEKGASNRGDQLKLLAGMIHEEKISPRFHEPLSRLIDMKTGKLLEKGLSAKQQSAVREWHRDYMIDTVLPTAFVEDFAKLSSESINIWRAARKNNDFKSFLPSLTKLVEANRKKAEYLGYKEHIYDALLDLYEPGMTTKTTTSIFATLKKGNVELLKKIAKKPKIDTKALYTKIGDEAQLNFCKKLLKTIGFDFKQGRLDLSTHPFSTGNHPSDSRITTRLQDDYIFGCLSTILHEAGHSFYTMGLPAKEFGSPLGQPISMGIHESQSRFWETRIGLSLPFMEYLVPELQKEFPNQFKKLTPELCYRAINTVEPSFIRVEADEVTYPLHVILRFELEKALIEGSLKVKDVPEAWNAKMQELLGITPPDDAHGCLQDIHWSMGAFGYFPTYALGNLFAAEIFTQFVKEHPDYKTQIAADNFKFIKQFLNKHVYQYGRQFRSRDLIQNITGKPFSAKPYVDYLNDKYLAIYK